MVWNGWHYNEVKMDHFSISANFVHVLKMRD